MGDRDGSEWAVDQVKVLVSSLLPADSPRSGGEDEAHVTRLAEVDGALPPLLVHRGTMRVIDGMHRLRTAVRKGRNWVYVEFFDGTDEDAFARGVELNTSHGLPLSVPDRKAAAKRILSGQPTLSDRTVAAITGLAAKTVAAVRACSTVDDPAVKRTGADGRRRPLNGDDGRSRAVEILRGDPNMPLRDVAASASISVGTAHDVRTRLRAGEDPVRARTTPRPVAAVGLAGQPAVGSPPTNGSTILYDLTRDPAVRFNEQGRELLRLLHSHGIQRGDWTGLIGSIPPHCAPGVARLADQYAEEWRTLARHLDPRTKTNRQ